MRSRKDNTIIGTEKNSRIVTWVLSIGLIVFCIVAWILLGGRQFILVHHYDQLKSMEQEVSNLRTETRDLKVGIESVRQSSFRTELVARERMNYCVPGELIFRFISTGIDT